MTGAIDAAAGPVGPDAKSRWRAARVPVIAGSVLLLTSVAIAIVLARNPAGRLDPTAYDPSGSRALAALLTDRGVEVTPVRSLAEADATVSAAPGQVTLLVTTPDLVPAAALGELSAAAAATVLVAPGPKVLDELDIGLVAAGTTEVTERRPACGLPAARAAGTAATGGQTYLPGGADAGPVALCYPASAAASVARAGTVTALGAADPLTNAELGEVGNAALSLGLLGGRADLVWYLPSPADAALGSGQQKSLVDLAPRGVKLAAVQLFLAAVLVALWRARRLGPVVHEPLPVVVRSAEATEGRARLYHRAGARGRAADALREGTVTRLAPRFGLSPPPPERALVEALARHTGRSPVDLHDLLYGSPPSDDAQLVALADALDALERQVRDP